MAVNFQPIPRSHALIEPQGGDAKYFTQRGLPLGCGIVRQPPRELAQDRCLAVTADADDERHAELGAVGIVEAVEVGEFLLAQPVKPGGGLLGGGVGRQLAFARRLAGEIGMAVDQRALAFVAGILHRVRHGLIERRQACERALGKSLVGDPGRKLHHVGDGGGEGLAVGGVEAIERNRIHADDFKSSATPGAWGPR